MCEVVIFGYQNITIMTTLQETLLIVEDLIQNGEQLEATSSSLEGELDGHHVNFAFEAKATLWSGELTAKIEYWISIDGMRINEDNIPSFKEDEIKDIDQLSNRLIKMSMQSRDKSKQVKFYNERLRSLRKQG